MKFNLGVGFLLFVTGTFADMVPGDYTCWNGKCAGKCDPIDGGRDGTVTDTIIHHGDNWCYLQAGRDENMLNEPRKCSPALGCAPPQEGHVLCVTKDYDEGLGGCTSENS
ncbi:predicted protein [Aspergillus terreus NIH2624]|uniref:Uncharacterized protein n=1 Tax=Aspergillus terreus (strain NIH 2624 / FGSC A1156) TaxID=341663 RepID=Q0CWP5_ASPTN|nr:uncharacterized protein ATEG_01889 [Aspergillus terreus NIH2624]EAU38646.1 predicted protein [Aspergillus terreus NIH2624]